MFSKNKMFDLSPDIVSARRKRLLEKKESIPVVSLLKWMDPRITPLKLSSFLEGETDFILDLPVFKDREPYEIAEKYLRKGFKVFSVSTNPFWNKGYDDYISFLKRSKFSFTYPVIRRDIFFESYQIVETRLFLGDSFTIIPGIVEDEKLKILIDDAFNLDFEPVVVLSRESDLKKLKKSGFNVPFIATEFQIFKKIRKKLLKLDSRLVIIIRDIDELEMARDLGAKLFWFSWELVENHPDFF